MVILSKQDADAKTAPREDVEAALDKIFSNITTALEQERVHKLTLDQVDETLNVLFEAVNRAKTEGANIRVPDFKRILSGEF